MTSGERCGHCTRPETVPHCDSRNGSCDWIRCQICQWTTRLRDNHSVPPVNKEAPR